MPESAYYDVAMSDYGYVFSESKRIARHERCSLFPEMYTKIGELEMLRGRPKEAEQSYFKAISLKPTYVPAYVGLSDFYETQGLTDKAIATLQQGIKANPQSSALKKKLQRVEQRTSGSESQR